MKQLRLALGIGFLLIAGIALQPASALAGEKPEAAKTNPDDPIFVDMAPLVLPVISGNTIEQLLQITVTIEVADQTKADKVKMSRPRLADAYVQDLYGAIDRRAVLNGNLVDISRLRDALTRASIAVLGENSFSKILIQRVSQRGTQG